MTDIVWKIVVGGSGGVGKTTFLHRYLTKQFLQDSKLTVGVSFQSHCCVRQGKNINLVLWDLGGQERFRFVQKPYIKGAVAAFVMFDMSRFNTLLELKEWIELIRETTSSSVPIMLVGSKLDLIDPDDLPSINKEADQFAKEMNLMGCITISSKSGENVEETMEKMVDVLLMQKTQGKLLESTAKTAT
ncbi:MAG TPA: Rab family GTPase [Candidatus Lokiarchaeia archaeon]|nr:Rab family GTPase [Candidatus Lokiarchaeia archaeon]